MLPFARRGLLSALQAPPPTFAVLRASSHTPHMSPGTHNPAPEGASDLPRNPPLDPPPNLEIVTRERRPNEDALGPPSGALVGDKNDPNVFAEGVAESLKMADAYVPCHSEAYTAIPAERHPKAIDLGPAKIVTPLKDEIPESTPPPDVSSQKKQKEGEKSRGEGKPDLGHVEYTNVMQKRGEANEETAQEMHEKGP